MVIFFFAMIIGITFLMSNFFKERFGYLLPASIILSSFILFFSQILFRTFMVGTVLAVLLGIIGNVICLYWLMLAKKQSGDICEKIDFFFSPGFYAFIIIFFYAFIAYSGRHFSAWDEMSHWGHMVKEMVRLDRFYIVPEARYMAHKDYPPIIQIFEYFVCEFMGGYSEGNSSVGIQLIILSFTVPLFTEKYYSAKEKAKIKYLFVAAIIMIIVMLLYFCFDPEDIYRTIMVDCSVSAVGAYSVILALDNRLMQKKGRIFCLLLSMAYLPLCKQIGLAFVLLSVFACFIAAIQNMKNESLGRRVVLLVFMILLPLLSLIIWSKVIEPYHFSAQFDLSSINIKEVVSILLGGGTWEQHYTYGNYLRSLLNVSLTTGPFPASYFTLGVVAIVILSFSLLSRKNEECNIIRYVRYLLVFTAGITGYALTMLIMYMYGFSYGEMLGLASFSRYMNIYVIYMFLILLSVLVENRFVMVNTESTGVISLKHGIGFLSVVLLVLLLTTNQNRLLNFLPSLYGNETRDYQELAIDIDSYVEYDDSVLLVSDNNNMYYPFLRYYCNDAILSGNVYYSEIHDEDLCEFDYVYVINKDEFIDSIWCPILSDPSQDLTPGMYKIFDFGESYRIEKI